MNENIDAIEKDADLLDNPEKEDAVPEKDRVVDDTPIKDPVEDEDDEEVVKEEDEEQTDEDEPKEEEEDDVTPEGRVSFKEITAKYPEIFKELPHLRGVIARGNQYDDMFGSVKDAQQALENLQSFDQFGKQILAGDSKFLLKSIGEQDPAAFEKFSTSFLDSVRELHPQTYVKVVTPVIKAILRSAQSSSDQNVALAGKYIQKFLQMKELTEEAADPSISRREQELIAEKRRVEEGSIATFVQDTNSEGKDKLFMICRRDIDPEGVMSPKTRDAAARDLLEQADELAGRNQRHLNNMNRLWREAKSKGMNRESREAIVRAYLAHVKTLLPGLRQKVREDYLGPRKVRKEDGQEGEERKVVKHKTHIPTSSSQGKDRVKKIDLDKIDKNFYKDKTDMDILDM